MAENGQMAGAYAPSKEFIANAHVNAESYAAMYAASVTNPEAFWAEQGKRLDWITDYTIVKNTSFEPGKIDIKWFEDGQLNISANCIDRHMLTRANQTAIIWEPDDPKTTASKHITYAELLEQTWCSVASRPTLWPTASTTATPNWSSPPTGRRVRARKPV